MKKKKDDYDSLAEIDVNAKLCEDIVVVGIKRNHTEGSMISRCGLLLLLKLENIFCGLKIPYLLPFFSLLARVFCFLYALSECLTVARNFKNPYS